MEEERLMDRELFKKHFSSFQKPSDMFKELYTPNDKEKNRLLVNVINSTLQDLKKEIEEMSEEEKK